MIIFLYGPDTFRSRQKLKEMKDKFIRDIDKSAMNLNILDGEHLELETLEKDLNMMPFLATKRMVVIENLISGGSNKKTQKGVLDLLKNKKAQASAIVIFWEGEIEKRTAASNLLFKNLSLEKYVYKFDFLQGSKLKGWYEQRFNELGAKIKPEALNLLIDLVGNDLWRANSELEKLSAYSRNREITEADVKIMTKNKIEENIFELTDALGLKNKRLALKLINDQLKAGTKAIELLNSVIWHFKNLLLAKSLIEDSADKNITSWQLSSQFKLHPFVAKKILGQVRNFRLEELKKIYQKLLDIDIKIKTSQIETEVLFDLLIF